MTADSGISGLALNKCSCGHGLIALPPFYVCLKEFAMPTECHSQSPDSLLHTAQRLLDNNGQGHATYIPSGASGGKHT